MVFMNSKIITPTPSLVWLSLSPAPSVISARLVDFGEVVVRTSGKSRCLNRRGNYLKAKSRPPKTGVLVSRGLVCGSYFNKMWGVHNDTTVIPIVLIVLIVQWAASELTR